MKKKLNLISLFAVAATLLCISSKSHAQISQGPRFYISSNTNTAKDACVNQDVPNRSAIAQNTTVAFSSGTIFVLELSDIDGVFDDATLTELSRFETNVDIPVGRNIDFDQPFSMSTNFASDNYSMRIRVIVDGQDDVFSAVTTGMRIYFFDTDNPLTLVGSNIDANNVALCDGESSTLTASPSDYPEYVWSFNGTTIDGETGPTLTNVTAPGQYSVRIDLGGCEGFYGGANIGNTTVLEFNQVTVSINEPSPQEFCPSDIKILSVSVNDPGFQYVWMKDGEVVPELTGATVNLTQSDFAGIYTVIVTGSDTCSETTLPVEVVNLGSALTSQPPPQLILLPTQPSLTLEIETNAPPPGSTVQWYRDVGTLAPITPLLPVNDPGALSVDVSDAGIYVVRVFADDVCMDILEATTEVFTTVGFNAVITTLLDCDADTGTLGLENLFGITTSGAEVPITAEQLSFFDFEWFLGTQSTGVTESTFTVTSDNVGEIYALEVTLPGSGLPTARSNDLEVELLSDNLTIDASSTFIPFGETVTLSVLQSTNYVYEWFTVVDGENQSVVDGGTITGQGTNTLETGVPGQYFVRITLLDCELESDVIVISENAGQTEIIPNVVTPNNDGINDNWLLPESLFNQQDVEVTIYNIRGQVDFSIANYQNNWPRENSKSSGQDPIYYYIITKNNSVVRKGSITVMR